MGVCLHALTASPSLAQPPAASFPPRNAAPARVRAPEETAKLMGQLDPDHVVFPLLDAAAYLLIFAFAVAALRAALRASAPHEADEHWPRYLLASFLIVAFAGLSQTASIAGALRPLLLIPAAAAGVYLINWLCWAPWPKAALAMAVFSAVVAASLLAARHVADQFLPGDRTTLLLRMRAAMDLTDEYAGREGEAFFTKENLRLIAAGWKLQAEALKSATLLLRDPEALDKVVADHQESLDALGLLAKGGTNAIGQLAQIGIVYAPDDPALRGISVLQNAGPQSTFSEQDVEGVAKFLKSVRKDNSDVTARDVAAVIRDAMRRRAQAEPHSVVAVLTSSLADTPTGAVAQSSAPAAGGLSVTTAAPVCAVSPAGVVTNATDPFARLDDAERAAWIDSKSAIVVSAIARYGGDSFILKVNDRFLRPGDSVRVEKNGRFFRWRLVSATLKSADWEPIIDEAGKVDFTGF